MHSTRLAEKYQRWQQKADLKKVGLTTFYTWIGITILYRSQDSV